jgi:hypothetical protein
MDPLLLLLHFMFASFRRVGDFVIVPFYMHGKGEQNRRISSSSIMIDLGEMSTNDGICDIYPSSIFLAQQTPHSLSTTT